MANITRKNIFDPKTFVESGGGQFQEGNIQVVESKYLVHKAQERQAKPGETVEPTIPHMVLAWRCKRLNEQLVPMTDESGEIFEDLQFGFGTKSLQHVHPGRADSPDDEQVEDAGTEVGASGPTIVIMPSFEGLNTKSSLSVLINSLVEASLSPTIRNRAWAPDYVGGIFHMKSTTTQKNDRGADVPIMIGSNGKPVGYKVVDKIHRQPTGKLEASAPAGGNAAAPASSGGAAAPAGGSVEPKTIDVLKKFSKDNQGKSFKRKAFYGAVAEAMDGVIEQGQPRLEALTLIKNDTWLANIVDNEEGVDAEITKGDDGKMTAIKFTA